MSGYLDWKHVDKDGIRMLESSIEENETKRLLQDIFQVTKQKPSRQPIMVDFHFHNYAFCKRSAFDSRQTSTFMSLMVDVFSFDMGASTITHNMHQSFRRFQDLLLKHSVERPPKSVQIFQAVDVERIADFALNSYYRNYNLYIYIFGVQTIVTVKQQAAGGVEYPHVGLPLSMGTAIPTVDTIEIQQ